MRLPPFIRRQMQRLIIGRPIAEPLMGNSPTALQKIKSTLLLKFVRFVPYMNIRIGASN